jgi:hypothetical protein
LLDSKHSWASRPTKTPFRCEFYLNLHQIDKHICEFIGCLAGGTAPRSVDEKTQAPGKVAASI